MNKKDDDTFSTRELEICFSGVHEKLDIISEQVTKTNGRVSALEKWRSFMTGGLAVLTALAVPVMLYVVYCFVAGHL